jgi:hypothetical protein
VVGTLRQRYAECRAASKVFNKPRSNMALEGYSISMMLKVMYSMRGVLGGAKGNRQCYYSNGLDSFTVEAIEGASSVLSTASCCNRFFQRSTGRVYLLG